jgi:mannobiose 2-epimerase
MNGPFRILAVAVATLVCSSPTFAAETKTYNTTTHPPTKQTYLKLADEMEKHLREQVLAKWYPAAIDRENGGFYSRFREDFSRDTPNHKTIIFQGRMTWTAAQVALRYPDLAEEYKAYARHGVKFLNDVMWDRDEGGFFWGLDEKGQQSREWGAEKHAYGISFGIYGAAVAYAATKDPAALDLAQRAFLWFDEHAHDAKNGGYHEALGRKGEVLLAPHSGRERDLLSTPYGFKSMNSHIHLLEAMTALYEVWPDERVEKRLRELHAVVRDKVAVEPGCLNLYFTPDWRAVPDHDSFGHDVETAYLLIEAATVLGQPDEPKTHRVGRALVDHALRYGWDRKHGGFYDRGFAFAPAYGLEKVWWTQAEGLNALMLMHELHGSESPRYYEAFLQQWQFIVNHQADARHGEWHELVSHDGVAQPGRNKAHIWKAAYHNGRALMNVSAMLRKMAEQPH